MNALFAQPVGHVVIVFAGDHCAWPMGIHRKDLETKGEQHTAHRKSLTAHVQLGSFYLKRAL